MAGFAALRCCSQDSIIEKRADKAYFTAPECAAADVPGPRNCDLLAAVKDKGHGRSIAENSALS